MSFLSEGLPGLPVKVDREFIVLSCAIQVVLLILLWPLFISLIGAVGAYRMLAILVYYLTD